NSLTKTISSAISKGHSREDSWGRTAIKMAKSGVAICGSCSSSSHQEDLVNGGGSSGTTTGDHMTAIGQSGTFTGGRPPALTLQQQLSGNVTMTTTDPSPLPSPFGDLSSRIGIAISTPLPQPSPSEASYDAESLRMSHPYAQGGAYTFRQPSTRSSRAS